MRNKLFVVISLLMIASMALAACAPAATPTAGAPQVTEVVKTVVVTVAGQEVVVTATPQPTAPPPEFKSKDPTTLVYVTYGEPETLDPALDYETAGQNILQNVYETLVFPEREKPGVFVPMLATEIPTTENGGISADGMTYTFKIRSGVKFHNGDDMTPSDVAYSFQRGLLQGGTASPQWLLTEPFFGTGISDVAEVVDPSGALDDDTEGLKAADPATLKSVCEKVQSAIVADDAAGTVTMHLAQPWGPLIPTLAQTWGDVMDQKWVADNGGWDGSCDTWQNFYAITSENDPFTSIANGTGPFMLDHWTKGEEVVMARNDNYWVTEPLWEGGPTGPAALERVVYKIVNEWGTRFAMLQAGDADIATVNADAYSQADTLVGDLCLYNNDTSTFDPCQTTDTPDQPLRLWKGDPRVTHTDVFMNFNITTEGGNPYVGSGQLDGNGIPPDFFDDIHVRKAFNYCFDWDTFISDAMAGEGIQIHDIPVPGMPGYHNDDPIYSYDPAKCEEEFKAAELKSADGQSLWDIGFRLQAAYNTGNTTRQTVAEILGANLNALNDKFQVEVIGLPWPTFLRAQRAKILPLFIVGWQEDIHDPHNWYQPYLVGTYGRLQSLPQDYLDQFQAILNQGVSESDPAKRDAIYAQANKLVYDLAPDILLAIPTGRTYTQRWVNGYFRNPVEGAPGYYYAMSKN